MRRLLLPLLIALFALFSAPDHAQAQCNGQFGANQVCGSLPGGFPGPVNFSSFPGSGSVAWINVKTNCGATGNGSTDDTAAINTCIATFNSAANGVLYFPAGTYKTTSALTTITANGVIIGDGQTNLEGQLSSTPPNYGGVAALPATVIESTSSTANLFTVGSQALIFQNLSLKNISGVTPTAGAGIFVSSTAVCMKVDYENIQVSSFYIDVDIKVGCQWTMHNSTMMSPILYALRINNTVLSDAGDWSINSSYFHNTATAATTAIRIEGSGGGKINNVKINGDSGLGGSYGNGIDIISNATVDMQITNSSIENFSGTGINISGSWPDVTIMGLEIGSFNFAAAHAITASSTSLLVIDGITLSTGFSGAPINLSSCTNCYVSGIIGSATPFSGGSKPDHDGSGGIGTFYLADGTVGTESRIDWHVPAGQYGEFRILLDSGTPTKASAYEALDDLGNHAIFQIPGSTSTDHPSTASKALLTGSLGVVVTSDDGGNTGGTDDISLRAGGYSQEALLIQHNGHIQMPGQNSVAPTLTAGCNGAGAVVSGNDANGTITGQTAAATTCTLSFGTAYASAPNCAITGLSSPLTGAMTVGTGSIVVNFASTANYKWSYICFGK